jgi:hypothetical protein
MSGIYNYHIKLDHLNEQLPQMSSEMYRPPFYFGGSQVPINLGFDNNASIKSQYSSSLDHINDTPMVGHGLGVGLKTTMRKNDNIRRAKYMFHK